jgi:hypothetical protein
VLIPLDDRPCNRLFPQQLAAISGARLLLPPTEHLGWYTQPGECKAIADWLASCRADRFVISADMLCYGGLVASRTPAVETGLALRRLELLRELRRRRPESVIYAFGIVMRLGTTVTDAESLSLHLGLGEYSQLVDRVQRLGEVALQPELDAVTSRLGTDALAQYLAVRRRNHTVNRALIALAADGVIDYLILAQEDSAPVGIHVAELLALRGHVDEFRVADQVAIHPGADEVGIVLMARHHARTGQPTRISVEYASPEGAEIVPRFEHQPISQTVESQIRAAGAHLTLQASDAHLAVHTPIGAQTDIADAPPMGLSPALAEQANLLVAATRSASSQGALVGLADLAYCNGADPELIAALRRVGAGHLAAFAGWNTAANTLGTVIAQLCIAASAADDAGALPHATGNEAARDFIASRLVDDYGYQSCVRRLAHEQAAAIGANPFRLGHRALQVEQFVQQQLQPFSHLAYSDLLGAPSASAERVRVSLPWQRLFEVELKVEDGASAARPEKNLS